MIRGYGPSQATIAIVGDIASTSDIKENSSLTGGVGSKLDFFLKRAGVRNGLDDCYKTVLVKEQVPGYFSKAKKVKNAAINSIDLNSWRKIIVDELAALSKVNVVLALGELPLNALTGEKGIHNFRGSILRCNSTDSPDLRRFLKIIPSIHPREVFQKQDNEILLDFDIRRTFKYSTWPAHISFPEPNITPWVCRTHAAFMEWWKRSKKAPFITVDIETYYGFITCIGLSGDGKEGISVPLTDDKMPILERVMLVRAIDEVFRSGIPLVNQNIKFDWSHLESWGYTLSNIHADTMVEAHTCYPELLKNIGFLTSIYTEMPYYKDEGKEFNPCLHSFAQLLLYNAKDAIAAWQIHAAHQQELEDQKVKEFYYGFVQKLIPAYKKVDDRGLRIDTQMVDSLHSKYSDYYATYLNFIKSATGVSLNVNSYKQVGSLVYDILQCPKHSHTTDSGDDTYDTDEETLEGLYINEIKDPGVIAVVKAVVACRKLYNVVEFLGFHPSRRTSKFHTQVKVQGTKSGRTSNDFCMFRNLVIDSDGHLIQEECGGALQTIPKHGFLHDGMVFGADVRKCFIPSKGYAFVDGDSAQGEARIVCVLAEDYDTLVLMDKDDLHIITASMTKQIPRSEIEKLLQGTKEQKDEYGRIRQDFGKKPRHAGNYDMGAYRLSIMIHLPVSVCEQILMRFHEYTPKLRMVFHQGVKDVLAKTKCLWSPQGRRRDFFGKITDKLHKEAYSWIPQATLSDNTKQTILDLQAYFDGKYGFRHDKMFILAESHDNLLSEVRFEHINEYVDIFSQAMEREIDFNKCSLSRDFRLRVPVDIGISTASWWSKDFKKWKGSYEASMAA